MDTNVASPVCSTETDWLLVVHLTTLSGEQRVPCLEYYPTTHCLAQFKKSSTVLCLL